MVESTKSPRVSYSFQESQQSSLKKRSLKESTADTKKQGGATKKQKIDEPPVTQEVKSSADAHMMSIDDQEKTLKELRTNNAAFYSDIQSKAYREGEHFAKLMKN